MNNELTQFWDERIYTMKQWRKQHPEYAPKIHMVMKKFENMQIQHIKLLQEHQYRKSKTSLAKAEALKQEAEELYKKLSKLELIATLAK